MKGRIQHPMYTAAALAAANPVLLKGEVVYESDTRKRKIGDGVTPWNNLVYEITSGASGGNMTLGPFPGYRQIASKGEIGLSGLDNNLSIAFTSQLTAAELIGGHILFDAELSDGFRTLTSIPAAYAKIANFTEAVTVVDFTTANPEVIGTNLLLSNVRGVVVFEKIGNFITGCQLSATYTKSFKSGGSSSTIKVDPILVWHGIYLEEVPQLSITE